MKLIVVIFALLCINVSAQKISYKMGEKGLFGASASGEVLINSDKEIDALLKMHIKNNELDPQIPGWRLQIYLGTGRAAMEKANRIKEEFELEYPETGVYIVYQAPYFKVRVGDFRKSEKTKVLKLKKKLSEIYPSCWIVEDNIEFPQLDQNIFLENE